MTESFLSWLWKFRQLERNLCTTGEEPLLVLHPGESNRDSGPDFMNARLKIGSTTWAGNVEIHVRSSDWFRHGHHEDPAYANTILHVVFENDIPVMLHNGSAVPTLELRDQVDPGQYERYLRMMETTVRIPCSQLLSSDLQPVFDLWAPALVVERLEEKAEVAGRQWEAALCCWDEAFYRHLCSSFGFRINNLPFEMLAARLPLAIVRRHAGDPFLLESLYFGLAGMLDGEFADEYPNLLQHEFGYLKAKYRLGDDLPLSWKFLRLRPSNFPTIRISQWAALVSLCRGRFFQWLEPGNLDIRELARGVAASGYWDTHYLFDKPSVYSRKPVGQGAANLLAINAIAPYLFFYGMMKDQPAFSRRALSLLEMVACEENRTVSGWNELGITGRNALHSQAMIQLRNRYCDRKRCLECRIGAKLLNSHTIH